MKGKKVLGVVMSAVLTLGLTSVRPMTTKVQAEPVFAEGGSFDGAIANPEKLIQMLKKEGKIAQNATPEEAEMILNNYLKTSALKDLKKENEKNNIEQNYIASLKKKLNTNGLTNGNGKKVGNVNVTPAKQQPYSGSVRNDKILVLLIDFPDYQHNQITTDETDMYYKDYSTEHFQDMIFGSNGYIGPNGEKLMSMKQYYEEQSGGSFTIEGQIAGWYRTKNPAAYYGAHTPTGGNDIRPRNLVYEALKDAAADPSINLADYDKLDPFDLNGNENTNEPDGIIDHVMVFHAGVGEEAGGGILGEDAIWSHSWDLGGVATIPGTSTNVPYWNGLIGAYGYTIEPEDGATGVFAHEFGHDLGLPDEYDTIYSGQGEAVSSWSIMANGSWAGKVPGTEPSSFSPYAKQFFQASIGGNWLKETTLELKDITKNGVYAYLDQSTTKGKNDGAVRINLSDKTTLINTPASGTKEYFSGKGDNLSTSMVTSLDLTGKQTAKLTFKTWYDIEQDYDYAYLTVKGADGNTANVAGNLTTTSNPYGSNQGNGITGTSNGWVNAKFDLSQFAGQKIELTFKYVTDGGVSKAGFYVDNINVTADGSAILTDDVETAPKFDITGGFSVNNGKFISKQYYLVEWRNHAGADMGLAHLNAAGNIYSYDPGMVIWYVDESYSDNWVGVHPGDGYLGVVDADQNINYWNDAKVGQLPASTRYQIHDAAFGLQRAPSMALDFTNYLGWSRTMLDKDTFLNTSFDDSYSYINPTIPQSGRNIPKLGLKIRVVGEASDRSAVKILIYK